MKQFNILDKDTDIYRNYLLEASAGTGKTFSIENLIVRLILGRCTIKEILVVTFTKESTKELKARIHKNLEKALGYLLGKSEEAFEYLHPYKEDKNARKNIEIALSNFYEAQIFTIHGFCQQILQENSFQIDSDKESFFGKELLSSLEIVEVIRDFFRTDLRNENYSPEQLKILLKDCYNQVSRLEETILHHLSKGTPILKGRSLKELLFQFRMEMKKLKENGFTAEKILSDFLYLAPFYKETCNRTKEIKKDLLTQVESFSNLFDKNRWEVDDLDLLIKDNLVILQKLKAENLKAKATPTPDKLQCLNLVSLIKNSLEPIVNEGRNQTKILANMVADCQQLLNHYAKEEEKFRYDDLIKSLAALIKNPIYAQTIREKYQAVIIDEFQDTDLFQWEIFSSLFLDKKFKGYLYLVGDPKQSIYGFRQADIYTYLKAADSIGNELHTSLDTNFRSQKSLVSALNALFGKSKNPFPLPKSNSFISYRPVIAGVKKEKPFSDSLGAVHFCIAESKKGKSEVWPSPECENDFFFPFLVEEIQRLFQKDQIDFNQWAVLVRDRFQAERLSNFCKKYNIPTITQRQKHLMDSPALESLLELLEAILDPHDSSTLRIALGGKLIGWTHEMIKGLSESSRLIYIYSQFENQRHTLIHEGFAKFFQQFLHTSWHSDLQTVIQKLVALEDGVDFLNELNQLAEILMEEQSLTSCSPEGLITFLQNFRFWCLQEEDRGKVRQDTDKKAVRILTLHMSKGLEFDIVFALGVANRTPRRSDLVYTTQKDQQYLVPLDEKDSSNFSADHFREIDAEKMRQLYVAMTRAKYRLYLPVAIDNSKSSEVTLGEASPMELFLESICETQNDKSQELMHWIDSIKETHSITYSRIISQPNILSMESSPPCSALSLKTVDVPGKSLFIHSFSTLSCSKKRNAKDDLMPPHNFEAITKNVHNLPTGNETGIFLHSILENIPFDLVRKANYPKELLNYLIPIISNSRFIEWKEVLSEIIFNALKTPISINQTTFQLCDIPENKCYRELEFLYPSGDNFIKGIIDLVIEVEGKYYIVDWKSNWLGPCEQYYLHPNLEQAMAEDNYHLQAKLYSEAWQRYLHAIDNSLADSFGGTIYLFLRGMTPKGSAGIYFSTFSRSNSIPPNPLAIRL